MPSEHFGLPSKIIQFQQAADSEIHHSDYAIYIHYNCTICNSRCNISKQKQITSFFSAICLEEKPLICYNSRVHI